MSASPSAAAASKVEALKAYVAANPAVKTVITQWIDLCGVGRCRTASVQRIEQLLAQGGGFNQTPLDMSIPATGGINNELFPPPYFTQPRGQIKPDVDFIHGLDRDASGRVTTAYVSADTTWEAVEPRANLRRLVQEAQEKHDLTFLVGFELEFCFFRPSGSAPETDPFTLVGSGLPDIYNTSTTHRAEVWPVLKEVLETLAEEGIIVEQINKEFGPSMYETALPPLPPLQSVDTYYYAMELIKSIAQKHGYVATFYPTPFVDGVDEQKVGQHIHLSATKGGEDGRREGSSFNPDELLGGIMSHLLTLMPIGLAQVDSYKRVGIGSIATGGLLGWGDHHRDMPVRRIHRNHWEFRCHDVTANAYAMVSGLIAAAMDAKPLTFPNIQGMFLLLS